MLKPLDLKHEKAFSLLELLVCISILGILLSLSAPSLTAFAEKTMTTQSAKRFQHAISLARATAITRNTIMTFCKSDNGLQCQGQWQQGSIVFADNNGNGKVDEEDNIILRLNPETNRVTILWRAFQNKPHLQINPRGTTQYQNGNFTFCPFNKDLHLAHQLIVNTAGRVRVAIDRDGDGIKERSDGSPLRC